jgi:hypothetical protein
VRKKQNGVSHNPSLKERRGVLERINE